MNGRPHVGALDLTVRQLEVVDRIGHGEDIKQIAHEMQISPYTVRGHLRNVMERLGARNGAHAYALCIDQGYLTPLTQGATHAG